MMMMKKEGIQREGRKEGSKDITTEKSPKIIVRQIDNINHSMHIFFRRRWGEFSPPF